MQLLAVLLQWAYALRYGHFSRRPSAGIACPMFPLPTPRSALIRNRTNSNSSSHSLLLDPALTHPHSNALRQPRGSQRVDRYKGLDRSAIFCHPCCRPGGTLPLYQLSALSHAQLLGTNILLQSGDGRITLALAQVNKSLAHTTPFLLTFSLLGWVLCQRY